MLPNFLMSDRTLEKVWSQNVVQCGGKCSFGHLESKLISSIDITDGADIFNVISEGSKINILT